MKLKNYRTGKGNVLLGCPWMLIEKTGWAQLLIMNKLSFTLFFDWFWNKLSNLPDLLGHFGGSFSSFAVLTLWPSGHRFNRKMSHFVMRKEHQRCCWHFELHIPRWNESDDLKSLRFDQLLKWQSPATGDLAVASWTWAVVDDGGWMMAFVCALFDLHFFVKRNIHVYHVRCEP